jgi:hypothetical protein
LRERFLSGSTQATQGAETGTLLSALLRWTPEACGGCGAAPDLAQRARNRQPLRLD